MPFQDTVLAAMLQMLKRHKTPTLLAFSLHYCARLEALAISFNLQLLNLIYTWLNKKYSDGEKPKCTKC